MVDGQWSVFCYFSSSFIDSLATSTLKYHRTLEQLYQWHCNFTADHPDIIYPRHLYIFILN